MQFQKQHIHETILREAERIFLKNGYQNTNMREIAEATKTGVGNIYNYFPGGKDEIFTAVLHPAIEALETMFRIHQDFNDFNFNSFSTEEHLNKRMEEYLTLLNQHRSLLHLLLLQSRGSSLEHFREELTSNTTFVIKKHFQEAKKLFPDLNTDISDAFIHMHTTWLFTLFEEIILFDPSPEEVKRIVREYVIFESNGWKGLLNRQ